jgi:hypothetical protein
VLDWWQTSPRENPIEDSIPDVSENCWNIGHRRKSENHAQPGALKGMPSRRDCMRIIPMLIGTRLLGTPEAIRFKVLVSVSCSEEADKNTLEATVPRLLRACGDVATTDETDQLQLQIAVIKDDCGSYPVYIGNAVVTCLKNMQYVTSSIFVRNSVDQLASAVVNFIDGQVFEVIRKESPAAK